VEDHASFTFNKCFYSLAVIYMKLFEEQKESRLLFDIVPVERKIPFVSRNPHTHVASCPNANEEDQSV